MQVLVKDENLKVKASELAENKEVISSSFINLFFFLQISCLFLAVQNSSIGDLVIESLRTFTFGIQRATQRPVT